MLPFAAAALLWRLLGPQLFPARLPDRIPVRLLRVADGDTLHVQPLGLRGALGGEEARLKVRLIGIDAPELGSADGFRAALALAELCEGAASLELESERSKDGRARTDKYGRTLGWLWVEPGPRYLSAQQREARATRSRPETILTRGPQLAQEILLQRGLVELYEAAADSKYYSRLRQAQR